MRMAFAENSYDSKEYCSWALPFIYILHVKLGGLEEGHQNYLEDLILFRSLP
jgi:hypothetical protein